MQPSQSARPRAREIKRAERNSWSYEPMSNTFRPTVSASTRLSEASNSSSSKPSAGTEIDAHCAACRMSLAYSASLLLLSLALAGSPTLDGGGPVSGVDIPRSA